MKVDVELLEVRHGECGCPEEAYLIGGVDTVIHFEPDGGVDVFMDGGDWGEASASLWAPSIASARATALHWAARRVGGAV